MMPISPADSDRLAEILTVDFTTAGRRSGRPITVEIWWFRVAGRFIITGTPGPRDWLANIRSNPAARVGTPLGVFEVLASEVTEHDARREAFEDPRLRWYSTQSELDQLVAHSPMIMLEFL